MRSGQDALNGFAIQANQDADCVDRFAWTALPKLFAQVIETLGAQSLHHRNQEFAVFAETDAAKARGDLLGRLLGQPPQRSFRPLGTLPDRIDSSMNSGR